MKAAGRRVLMCSCEGSMPLDPAAIATALGTEAPDQIYFQLCRAQIEAYRAQMASGESLVVCCGQEAPLFAELAAQAGASAPVCVDIRDRAGWSVDARQAAPKMAALIAESVLDLTPTPSVTLVSEGRILILGHDQAVLEAARRLSPERAVTCLLLPDHSPDLVPPLVRALGIFRGRPRRASGHLGAFSLAVDDLAGASPSARGMLAFETGVGERTLGADVVLDLTSGPPLLAPRDGWLRVDPDNAAALEKALAEVTALMGEFEKPRWITVDAAICAHSRNGQVACTRCFDVCPSGALTPGGQAAAWDAHACSGHGPCASVCPTGAIRFDVPAGNGLYQRLATLLETFAAAGGKRPVLLIHDAERGAESVAVLARFGQGLPAHVLPMAYSTVAALGPDLLLTALAKGASRVVVLADPAKRGDLGPLDAAASLAGRVVAALGWSCEVRVVVEADPAALAAALAAETPPAVEPAAEYLVLGGKRQTLTLALAHLHRHAPKPVEMLDLEAGEPFGAIVVDQAKCTLCLACIPVCPAKALSGHADKPSLGFIEANCVQCGLCRVTCPEKAITLVPRLSFTPMARARQTLKEEEPYCCIRCGKPFASKSVIDRMVERMSGHSMFAAPGKLDLIKMCEDCRVIAQYEGEEAGRPLAGPKPPVTRTTDDYLRERDAKKE
ncbi:Ferredoxin [Candidatus Terasakiella magnetica]|nr:Ferredoxin [Candidatus Terasakiella magnetica]